VPRSDLSEISGDLRAIERNLYAAPQIPENPVHRNSLAREKWNVAMQPNNPFYFRVKFLQDIELLGHDPECFDNYVIRTMLSYQTVYAIVINCFFKDRRNSGVVKHVNNKLR